MVRNRAPRGRALEESLKIKWRKAEKRRFFSYSGPMIYTFGPYSLDPEKVELSHNGVAVAVEPQVFALLTLLIANRNRMVPKEEIIERVWDGRIISDTSIATRVKQARAAIGDDGKAQKFIRTVHGQGFRFIGEVKVEGSPTAQTNDAPPDELPEGLKRSEQPSIAVLPFQSMGVPGTSSILADAIPHELIQALSKLRWLFVIARGSTFRFRGSEQDPQQIGKALGARYMLTGSVEDHGTQIVITTELCDTRTGAAIWGERFKAPKADVHEIRAEIVAKVIASLEIYIPLNEVQAARMQNSSSLDAWSNYHLGIQNMYRFTKANNEAAARYFRTATELDPGFARAHAGLSFTAFQNAFLRYGGSQEVALAETKHFAERSVELDPLDPFANFNMGRALMLNGDLPASAHWLDKAITLSPSYSQGHYSHAFSTMLDGKTESSLPHYEMALKLSPLDPFVYAMLAGCSLSRSIDGDYEEAAQIGERAANSPGAHYIVEMIALIGHSLNKDMTLASEWAQKIRARRPDATRELFFQSFPFSDMATKERLSDALAEYGF